MLTNVESSKVRPGPPSASLIDAILIFPRDLDFALTMAFPWRLPDLTNGVLKCGYPKPLVVPSQAISDLGRNLRKPAYVGGQNDWILWAQNLQVEVEVFDHNGSFLLAPPAQWPMATTIFFNWLRTPFEDGSMYFSFRNGLIGPYYSCLRALVTHHRIMLANPQPHQTIHNASRQPHAEQEN